MLNENNKCDKENVIRQLMKVEAQVTVTPLVEHGHPKVYFVNSCINPNLDCSNDECNNCNYCDCLNHDSHNSAYPFWGSDHSITCESDKSKHKFNYTLTQVICIEIPISIDAEVDIKEGIACCDSPDVNPKDDINKKHRSYMQML
nr:hypothetical protein [uncultured Aminipila sp.]